MNQTSRRQFLGAAVAATAVAEEAGPGLALGNRCHIFARPEIKEKLISCFGNVLGCGEAMRLKIPGISEPMLAWRFPGGGALSVEFTDEALNERQARRGAWLEIWSDDPAALKKKILEAGLAEVRYPATNTFYFAAPGGQIFGIVPRKNPGAGEMKR